MRFEIIAFALFAIALAQSAKPKLVESDYSKYIKLSYCKTNSDVCKKCYDNKFSDTKTCSKALQAFSSVARDTRTTYFNLSYCKTNMGTCTSCLKTGFSAKNCESSKKEFIAAKDKKSNDAYQKFASKLDKIETSEYYKSGYCKSNANLCSTCLKTNFNGAKCASAYSALKKAQKGTSTDSKNAYYKSDYCRKNYAKCVSCLKENFKSSSCSLAKNAYSNKQKPITTNAKVDKAFLSTGYCKSQLDYCKGCLKIKFTTSKCQVAKSVYSSTSKNVGKNYELLDSPICKKNIKKCHTCLSSNFKGQDCIAIKNAFKASKPSANATAYYQTSYCKSHSQQCKDCLNKKFTDSKCVMEKKIYDATKISGGSSTAKNQTEGSSPLNNGLAQKAMSFFKPTSLKKGKPVVALDSTGVSLYDGLPWDANDKAYELDNAKVNQYEQQYLGTTMKSSIVRDGNCSPKGIESDGVMCADFAATPILGFCDIDEAGAPIGWGTSTRPKKVAGIVKNKSTGQIYYLPLKCVGDAKGHTWPGGLAQTFLSTGGQKKGAWKFNNDGGTIKGSIIGNTNTDVAAIAKGYSSVTYQGAKVSVQLNLEVNKAVQNALSGYSLEGFISWKA